MRIVQYQTATIRDCDACGGSHGSMKLYEVVWVTPGRTTNPSMGLRNQSGESFYLVFSCPNKDNTVVLFERGQMEEAEAMSVHATEAATS